MQVLKTTRTLYNDNFIKKCLKKELKNERLIDYLYSNLSFRENSNARYHHFNCISTSPIFSYTGFQRQSSFQDISKSSFFFSETSSRTRGRGHYRSGGYLIGKFFFHLTFYSFKLLLIC